MANTELERNWDTQLQQADGDPVKAAIGILRCSQQAHQEWLDYLKDKGGPCVPGEGECAEDVDPSFHQRCIDEYEKIIATINELSAKAEVGEKAIEWARSTRRDRSVKSMSIRNEMHRAAEEYVDKEQK